MLTLHFAPQVFQNITEQYLGSKEVAQLFAQGMRRAKSPGETNVILFRKMERGKVENAHWRETPQSSPWAGSNPPTLNLIWRITCARGAGAGQGNEDLHIHPSSNPPLAPKSV